MTKEELSSIISEYPEFQIEVSKSLEVYSRCPLCCKKEKVIVGNPIHDKDCPRLKFERWRERERIAKEIGAVRADYEITPTLQPAVLG